MSDNNLIAREKDDYIRVGSKPELTFKNNAIYTKRVSLPVNKIQKIYNSKGDLVGMDAIKKEFDDLEVIHDAKTGETIVIIHNEGRKYKGIAICHEDDYYNSEVGFKLAFLRANKKMYDIKLKEYEKELNEETDNSAYEIFARAWDRMFK